MLVTYKGHGERAAREKSRQALHHPVQQPPLLRGAHLEETERREERKRKGERAEGGGGG